MEWKYFLFLIFFPFSYNGVNKIEMLLYQLREVLEIAAH